MASRGEVVRDLRTQILILGRSGDILASLRRSPLLSLAAVAGSCGLWAWSLRGVDPRAMGEIGLLSILPWTAYAALAALVVSFALTLVARPRAPFWILMLHVAALVALVHGTPALLYGTLRYSWAWKHVGIVDYIDRLGGVDPSIANLSVYHNWPGFFGFNALLTQAAAWDSAASYASWAPLVFDLLYLGGVVMVVRAFTDDHRTIALSAWFFALANWVGQDYFGPQALAFFWYLVVLAILLRWFATAAAPAVGVSPTANRDGLLAAVVLLLLCITSTHQLTPFNTILALTALVAFNRITPRTLPILMTVLTATWLLFVADTFVPQNLVEAIRTLGRFGDNLSGQLIDYRQATAGPVLVSHVARGLTVLVTVLGALGAVRSFRRGDRHWSTVLLGLSPAASVFVTSYGDEARLRLFLFALPFLAFFAAVLIHPPHATVRRGPTAATTIVISAVMLVGFLYAYLGNERAHYFTPGEVAAAEYVYGTAPPNSLLIEGSRNYPSQFHNYERFTYVPISREPPEGRLEMVADPVGVLSEWMSNDRYAATYLIITRAQKAETDSFGDLPPGGLAKIERLLRESPMFRLVYGNADASVFTLARNP